MSQDKKDDNKPEKKKQNRLSTRVRKKAMIAAMKNNLGIVSASADVVGLDRRTHQRWMKEDADYRAKIEDIDERALDFSEAALLKRIQNEDTTAIIFHLKTKGKKRGYIETNHTITTDIPTSALEDKTNEELLAILNRDANTIDISAEVLTDEEE